MGQGTATDGPMRCHRCSSLKAIAHPAIPAALDGRAGAARRREAAAHGGFLTIYLGY